MKAKLKVLVAVLGLFYPTVPAVAHHGFDTEYDKNQKFSLTGVVTEVRWENPHMRVFVDVTDKNGVVTNYNLELDSPNNIRRMGWGKNDLLPGDKVNIEGNLGLIVKNRGSLSKITKVGEDRPLFKRDASEENKANDAKK